MSLSLSIYLQVFALFLAYRYERWAIAIEKLDTRTVPVFLAKNFRLLSWAATLWVEVFCKAFTRHDTA